MKKTKRKALLFFKLKNKTSLKFCSKTCFSMQAKNLFLASKQNQENDFTTKWCRRDKCTL